MKKVLLKSITVIAVAALFSSCAIHNGYMSNSAVLSSANFTYLHSHIKGEATATYILGFGGLAKKTLVDNAKQNMLRGGQLEDNQALANLTVNFKTSNYLLVRKVQCVITSDIVEFN